MMKRPLSRRPKWLATASCGLLATLTSTVVPGPSAVAAAGNVTGTVFQDFNSNGVNDSAAILGVAQDIGVEGVAIRGFDSTGALVGTTVTGTGGSYTLAVTAASTNDVRVEFEIPAAGALDAFMPSFATPATGATGSTTGTTVQFATIGATNVNLGINVPGEFCQNNPDLVVTQFCAGNVSAAGHDAQATVRRFKYDGSGLTTVATSATSGNVYGVAWDAKNRRVLSSQYVRRHAGVYENPVGSPLPGAVFTTNPLTNTTSFLVDLGTLGVDVLNSQALDSNVSRGLPDDGGASVDSDFGLSTNGVYEEVGKIGLGDIDVDSAGNLWVVSLADRKLYRAALPAGGGAPTTATAVGLPGSSVTCTNGVARPFGVTAYRGDVYVGVVCDASTGTAANLDAHVVKYDGAAFSSFLARSTSTTRATARATSRVPPLVARGTRGPTRTAAETSGRSETRSVTRCRCSPTSSSTATAR